jgi:Fe2+ or Zn2+ uptake regulation protein
MALATEMYCDGCGEIRHFNNCIGKVAMERWARQDGWSIGKYHLCPECRKKKSQLIKEGWLTKR